MSINGVPARELHESEAGTPPGRASVTTARVAFVGALRAEQSMASAPKHGHSGAQARASDKNDPLEETLVVNFQPFTQSAGPILVAAQVVSVRLTDLVNAGSAPAATSAPASASVADSASARSRSSQIQVTVEVQSPDTGRAHACVRVPYGPLGPITVDLELNQGRVELRAAASNERAADALRAGENALRQGLALAGITLESMQVVVGKRRATSGTRPSARRRDQGQEES